MSSIKAGEAYVSINADNSGLMRGLSIAQNSVTRFNSTARVVVAVTLDNLKYTVNQLTDLQDKIKAIQGVTGASATALKGLEDAAKSLGASTSWTAGEVAEGMLSLARIGQTTDQISASIAPVMTLARSIGVSVSDAANAVGASLNQFKLEADDAAHVVDVYAAATNSAAISSNELAESMKYAGTAGGAIGQSLEDTVAIVQTFRNLGYSAEQAGTLVKALFSDLQRDDRAATLEGLLDIDLKNAAGNFRPVLEALADGKDRAEALGEALTSKLLDGRFSVEAATALNALVTNLDATKASAANLKDVDGYAANLSSTMESGLSGSIALVRSAVDGLAVTISDSFEGNLKGALKVVTDAVGAVSEFTRANASSIAATVKAGAVVGVLSAGYRGLNNAVSVVVSALSSFRGVMRGLDGVKLGKSFDADLLQGLNKSKATASELLDQFRQIKATTGDAGKAQAEFSKALTDSGKMAANEADKVADVVRKVDAGEVSQKRFNTALKTANRSASTLYKTFKSVGTAVASLVAVEVIVEAGKAFYSYFTRAAEEARKIREEMEAATRAQKEARADTYKSTAATDRADTVHGLFEKARHFQNLTDDEKAAAGAELQEAVRNGVLTQQQAAEINNASAAGNTTTATEWAAMQERALSESMKRGAQDAAQAAGDVTALTLKSVLNTAYGTNIENIDELKSYKGGDIDSAAANKIAGAIQSAIVQVQAVQSSNISDNEKRVRVADIKAQTRAAIISQQAEADRQTATIGGSGMFSLNRADRAAYKRVSESAGVALNTYEEAIDAAVEATKYAQTAANEVNKQPTVTNDAAAFSFLDAPTNRASTANASQLGETTGAVEVTADTQAVEDATAAALERAKADKEAAKIAASESVRKLRSMNIEEVTAARVRNVVEKLNAAELKGVDVSDDRDNLRDYLTSTIQNAQKNVKTFDYSVQARVMSDAVSAAFSVSNNTLNDTQRQQLTEIRKLNDSAARQAAVCEEILAML